MENVNYPRVNSCTAETKYTIIQTSVACLVGISGDGQTDRVTTTVKVVKLDSCCKGNVCQKDILI